MQSIKYQNYQINCSVDGNEHGEVLVFLHGWPTNSKLWKSQVEALKTDYKTITLDWLGFGASSKPSDHKYTFTKKKEILDAVLTNLLKEDEKVNIIAHDIGGPPAILWASENQARVKRLILLNTILFPFSTITDKLSHFFFNIPIIKEVFASQFGLRNLMRMMTKSRGATIRKRIKEILSVYKNVDRKIILRTILEPVNKGKKNELLFLEKTFKDLSVNRYLIIAKGDPLCYAHMKKCNKNNPNIPTYFIDHCSHYIPIDQANELNKILIEILKKQDNIL